MAKKKDDKKEDKNNDAMNMRQKLEDNADEGKTYIRMALKALSDADKASNKAVLDKTREIINDTFRGEVGAKLAGLIANGVQLQHINEYMDSIEATRATPPSQSSSSSSCSSSGARRLSKEAVMDAALKEEKWRHSQLSSERDCTIGA